MSSFTAKYAIPLLQSADPVASSPTVLAALANRVDLLLGETGIWQPTLVAATAASQAIVLARTYPGNATAGGATPAGAVIITLDGGGVGAGVVLATWVTGWTGTATTVTGFTLNAISSTAGARRFHWRFLPAL